MHLISNSELLKNIHIHMAQPCKVPHDVHLCLFLEKNCFEKASSASPGCPLFSLCVVWKVSVCQAFKHCLSILPLYLVWLVSSHYCCFVFGRASRASMEEGRRAVCAQPGHLAAQRGRGRGGRWSRGSGSAGKRDISPPHSFSSFLSGPLFSQPLLSPSFFLLSHFIPHTSILVFPHWF